MLIIPTSIKYLIIHSDLYFPFHWDNNLVQQLGIDNMSISGNEEGKLLKRKDFLGVDEEAGSHPNRTYYYKKSSDVQQVIETCTQQIGSDHNNAKAYLVRGNAYLKLRDYANAIRDISHYLTFDPNSEAALYNRGIALSKIGQPENAIADMSRVLELNPDHVNAAFARAACFNAIGLFTKAIEDYNFALLKDENIPVSRPANSDRGIMPINVDVNSSYNHDDSKSPLPWMSPSVGRPTDKRDFSNSGIEISPPQQSRGKILFVSFFPFQCLTDVICCLKAMRVMQATPLLVDYHQLFVIPMSRLQRMVTQVKILQVRRYPNGMFLLMMQLEILMRRSENILLDIDAERLVILSKLLSITRMLLMRTHGVSKLFSIEDLHMTNWRILVKLYLIIPRQYQLSLKMHLRTIIEVLRWIALAVYLMLALTLRKPFRCSREMSTFCVTTQTA